MSDNVQLFEFCHRSTVLIDVRARSSSAWSSRTLSSIPAMKMNRMINHSMISAVDSDSPGATGTVTKTPG